MVDTEMYAEIQKRKRAGYSQRAVARELDLDRKTVHRYWEMTEDKYAHESGTRTPKADLTKTLANVLEVSPHALDVPDIDSNIGLMHTLFTLEDLRGLRVTEVDGEVCIKLDKSNGKTYHEMSQMLFAWLEQAKKLDAGEITKEEYDQWRYRYPEFDTTQRWVKVPSQELTDWLFSDLKDEK